MICVCARLMMQFNVSHSAFDKCKDCNKHARVNSSTGTCHASVERVGRAAKRRVDGLKSDGNCQCHVISLDVKKWLMIPLARRTHDMGWK